MNALFFLLITFVLALNVYATAVIVRSPRYERRQKWWQCGLAPRLSPQHAASRYATAAS